jgi:hypothetical protein
MGSNVLYDDYMTKRRHYHAAGAAAKGTAAGSAERAAYADAKAAYQEAGRKLAESHGQVVTPGQRKVAAE